MARWVTVDTRLFASTNRTNLDGFVHVVPLRSAGLHTVDMKCWCDPRIVWPEDGQTCIVSHKDKRPVVVWKEYE